MNVITTGKDRDYGPNPLVLFSGASSDAVAEAVRYACWIKHLPYDRVEPARENLIDQLGQAAVLVADTTGNSPIVSHDIGVAHGLGLPVICLRQSADGRRLADLQGIRFVYYSDLEPPDRERLSSILSARLGKILRRETQDVIDSFRERTEQIVADLDELLQRSDVKDQTLWYSGVLSPLALSHDGLEASEKKFWPLLQQERQKMIELGRKGCRVVCILSLPTFWITEKDQIAVRLKCLIEFIESSDVGAKIEWVWSEYRQKTLYLIGDVSCIERFRKLVDQGVDLTLRQTSEGVVRAHRVAYEALFPQLAEIMCPGVDPGEIGREPRRQAMLYKLKKLLADYYNG